MSSRVTRCNPRTAHRPKLIAKRVNKDLSVTRLYRRRNEDYEVTWTSEDKAEFNCAIGATPKAAFAHLGESDEGFETP